jgi:hypothetical protein
VSSNYRRSAGFNKENKLMNIEFYNERIVGFCEAGNRILSLVLLNYVNVWFAAQQAPELRWGCFSNGLPSLFATLELANC